MTLGTFEDSDVPRATGMVVLWSGLLSDIPEKFALCDGANGTPDLRDKFVRGVSDGASPGTESGGQSSYALTGSQLPYHKHMLHTDSVGDHHHSNSYRAAEEANNNGDNIADTVDNSKDINTYETPTSGSHRHHVDTSDTGASTPSAIDNTPPYYEVAYIMKL